MWGVKFQSQKQRRMSQGSKEVTMRQLVDFVKVDSELFVLEVKWNEVGNIQGLPMTIVPINQVLKIEMFIDTWKSNGNTIWGFQGRF